MGLWNSIAGWFGKRSEIADIKVKEATEKMENEHAVSFAKQDLDKMKEQQRSAVQNVGKIKAKIDMIRKDMKDLRDEIRDRTKKAEALVGKGHDELAKDQCEAISSKEREAEVLKNTLAAQTTLLGKEERLVDKLKREIADAKGDVMEMESMQSVVETQKNLNEVSIDEGLGDKMDARKRVIEEQMAEVTAIADVHEDLSGDALDRKTAEALGDAPGNDLFEKLKAKQSKSAD